jgi:hypothetical protein
VANAVYRHHQNFEIQDRKSATFGVECRHSTSYTLITLDILTIHPQQAARNACFHHIHHRVLSILPWAQP